MAGQAGETGTELSEPLKNGLGAGADAADGSLEPAEPVLETSRFRDEEVIEEAKYHSPAPAPPSEDGELPDSYGQPRVTLMVVSPYLVFAYWDVDLIRLPPETVSAALRFHELAEPSSSRFFEMDVDLRTRNWYVHLGSPAKSYYADLGVRTADGGFISLARSNQLETPRAWPKAEVEPVAIPAVSPVLSVAEPVSAGAAVPASVEAPSRPPESAQAVPSGPEERPAISPSVMGARSEIHHPAGADEMLQRRLAEIYALQDWYPRVLAAAAAQYDAPFVSVPDAPLPEAIGRSAPQRPTSQTSSQSSSQPGTPLDLTALAEHEFSPGFSSALLSASTPKRPPG